MGLDTTQKSSNFAPAAARPPCPLKMLGKSLSALDPSSVRELEPQELREIYREITTSKDEPGNRGLHSVDQGVELLFQDSQDAAEGAERTRWRVFILNTTETYSGSYTSRRIYLEEDGKVLIDFRSPPTDSRYAVLLDLSGHALERNDPPLDPLGLVSRGQRYIGKIRGMLPSRNGQHSGLNGDSFEE